MTFNKLTVKCKYKYIFYSLEVMTMLPHIIIIIIISSEQHLESVDWFVVISLLSTYY